MTNTARAMATHARLGTVASRDDADVIRRGCAAFNSADIDTLTRILDEDVVWHTPGRTSIGGGRRGRNAVFAQFGRYRGETSGTFRANLLDVFESGEGGVVGLYHNTGERSGKRLDVLCCIVFEIRDECIVSGREHFFDLYAWDEFWS